MKTPVSNTIYFNWSNNTMPKTIIVCACPYCNQIKIIDPGDNTFINQAEAESFALERCSCNGSASARDKARTKNEAHKVLEDLTDNEKQFDFLSDCAKMILERINSKK